MDLDDMGAWDWGEGTENLSTAYKEMLHG